MSPEEAMESLNTVLAHAWMVRTFLKHADEIQDDEEMLEVPRMIFDYTRALEPSYQRRDAKEYLRRAEAPDFWALTPYYVPQQDGRSCSVASVAMVLTARQAALEILDSKDCFPLVCDLLASDDLAGALRQQSPADAARLVTFFGLIPNFEPAVIMPLLAGLLQPDDVLLLSANLAPGSHYAAGVQRILSLYDNALTRDWLMTFLLDLGVEQDDGELVFAVQDAPGGTGLKRVVANFHFQRSRKVQVFTDEVHFQAEERLRLFFSYRHTPDQVSALLEQYGLAAAGQWISRSEEEGVFLCARREQTR